MTSSSRCWKSLQLKPGNANGFGVGGCAMFNEIKLNQRKKVFLNEAPTQLFSVFRLWTLNFEFFNCLQKWNKNFCEKVSLKICNG